MKVLHNVEIFRSGRSAWAEKISRTFPSNSIGGVGLPGMPIPVQASSAAAHICSKASQKPRLVSAANSVRLTFFAPTSSRHQLAISGGTVPDFTDDSRHFRPSSCIHSAHSDGATGPMGGQLLTTVVYAPLLC